MEKIETWLGNQETPTTPL
jgi:hypothetical protein